MTNINPPTEHEDWGQDLNELRVAFEGYDSGHWDWEKIDCCLTGRDADLDPWGQQGVELVSCNEDGVRCVAHIGKTFAGTDVCLNFPNGKEEDDAYCQRYLDAYLDQAQEIVIGCGVPGEWSGDDWFLSDAFPFTTPWAYEADGVTPDYTETAKAIIAQTEDELSPVQAELVLADEILNIASGWRDYNNDDKELVSCPEGKPGPGSVFSFDLSDDD